MCVKSVAVLFGLQQDGWYGRFVGCSWMFDEGCWHRSSHGDTAGRSLRVAEVGQGVKCSWTIVADSRLNRCPGFNSTLG